MSLSFSFFLPIRSGSQRVKNKNTRPFADVPGGILEHKLRQLLATKGLDEIILSTNDPEAMQIGRGIDPSSGRIRIVERPEHLCLDTTSLTDLIDYVPTITDQEHIMWGHATTPFAGAEAYQQAITTYREHVPGKYDSLLTVSPLKNFLIDPASGRLINSGKEGSGERWPRTQDLDLLYEVNHVLFMAPRSTYLEEHNRIGTRPYLLEQDKIVSFDIDWEDDFFIAEAIYRKIYEKN